MTSRWSSDRDRPTPDQYQARFSELARQGVDVHGEAHLVEALLAAYHPDLIAPHVLDAGCGTGRVAVELARRGFGTVGVDLDAAMLEVAQRAAPELEWVESDLAVVDLSQRFHAAVLAGNVLVFVQPGDEPAVIARVARHLLPGGLFICGFQVRPGGYGPAALDRDAHAAGLRFLARWATWDRAPWPGDGSYQVSLHQRPTARVEHVEG